jgi:formylglycine-generating enzyme required for sulfatase activity
MSTENFKSIPKQRYYDNQLLTVEDFQREQDFHIAYRQLQNQLLLEPGILAGLTVQEGATQGQVQIRPGVAIDSLGRVINLIDGAKFNGVNISVQSGQFLLDLSDQKYRNNTWLLTLEYNQEEESPTSTSSQYKEIPKFGLVLGTNGANSDQILLASLNVTTSQANSLEIKIDLSNRVVAVLASERIPNLPASKILGKFNANQIPELSADKITSGSFNVEQIPDLPASKITGTLDPKQLPDIKSTDVASLKFSLDKPNIQGEETVTLTWSSQQSDKVALGYIFENQIQQQEWNENLSSENTYSLNPYQTTTYTLTAYQKNIIQVQKQFVVQVIPNEFQYLKRLHEEGVQLSDALELCLNRYNLSPLTEQSVNNLVEAATRANYSATNARDILLKMCPDLLVLDLGNGIILEMVKIPAGSFLMGSEYYEFTNYSAEKPQHQVTLQEYYLGKYPVTQEQYQAVMGNNPSHFQDNSKNPVETVSWNDAKAFCEKVFEKTRQKVRLPTEAEWEYGCRAGTQTRYCFGDDETQLDEYAWYAQNSESKTHPVGQKKPNNWGLYDMHGNAWEWCEDCWHENYQNAPRDGTA